MKDCSNTWACLIKIHVGGDTGQQNDQGRSCGSWEKKANEAEIKAETYKAMYSELLEKIIQGGQNND